MPFQEMSVCAIRLSRLTATGAPDSGNPLGAWEQCAGIISVEFDHEIGAGEEFDQVDGCGRPCVQRKRPDYVKWTNSTVTFCTTDDALADLFGVGTLIGVAPAQTGHVVNVAQGCSGAAFPNGTCIEWWSEKWDCNTPNSNDTYRRHVLPRFFGDPQGYTDENGVTEITFEGFSQANANIGDGPFDDFPAALTALPAEWSYAEFDDDTNIPVCTVAGGEYVALP